MTRISSVKELAERRDFLRSRTEARSQAGNSESIIQVKVAMATCGVASGARPVFDYLRDELEKRNIPALVTQTGCMCYCYAEPTVEVTIPGKTPVMFGYVNPRRADEIIEKYIRKGEEVEGIIPPDYTTVDESQQGGEK
jgi:NADP-reducing hydrogenase subunit HndB